MRQGNSDKVKSYDAAHPCSMFFTRIVATFAREAKLFLLAKAASKNDFLRTIFSASDNGSVVDLPLFNVLQVVREPGQVICERGVDSFERFRACHIEIFNRDSISEIL